MTPSYLSVPELPEKLEVDVDESLELGEEPLQELRLHVQIAHHSLAEHFLDYLHNEKNEAC